MRFLLFSWRLLLSFISILFHLNNSLVHGQCREDQRALLIQLKQSLSIFNSSSAFSATSRLNSWVSNTDCCSSWHGVTCDDVGHVVGLDLSNESISRRIDNSSSLFELQYIQSLNLSYNTFNSTPIPYGFGRIDNLRYLNLSNSGFSGQIPIEISRLTRLVSLDLSTLFPGKTPLKLEDPDLKTLVGNLSELRELLLDGVNISAKGNYWCQTLSALSNLQVLSLSNCDLSGPFDSSLAMLSSLSKFRIDQNILSAEVPEFFANFSKLAYLDLNSCELYGKFPEKIFQLPLLQTLDISINQLLDGSLPEFPLNGSLQKLVISQTNFSGKLPDSIGNLRNLYNLELVNCGFSGSIPPSMQNLSKLLLLDLSSNYFTGPIPSLGLSENLTQMNLAHNHLTGSIPSSHWEKLPKLVNLNLRNNSLNGSIPSNLFTLPSLKKLDLANNQFSGQLGKFLNGSSMLDTLDLSSNMLEGPIPPSIFNISSLKIFTLSSNNFNGTLRLEMFQSFRGLSTLDLSGNRLSVNINGTNSSLFPKVGKLKLGSCKLGEFPDFLINQSTLTYLDLSNNQIRGNIPNWISTIGNGTLTYLNLSLNFLENPKQPFPESNFLSLAVVDLHSNLLQGQFPILPPSAIFVDYSNNSFTSIIPTNIGSYLMVTVFFSLSGNNLTGEIPESTCKAGYLQVLDLSNNSLNGRIPPCLGGIKTLSVLNLRKNQFHGPLPQTFSEGCSLRTLDLNGNRLEGNLPSTLANCSMLEVLDLGNNQINGTFPSWLAGLTQLRVLVLRSNRFHGHIGRPETTIKFPMLQIIDLSNNKFMGNLSEECFLSWKAMMIQEEEAQSKYKHQILRYGFLELSQLYYQDTVTVTNKGLEMQLVKILTIFTSIDLSSNGFEGEIPKAIGNLTSLYVLNLSHNALTGPIPRSIGKLAQLESLDLSVNQLSGEIPVQLAAGLTFLAVLNLSFNKLVGPIPSSNQFQTFSEASFQGNDGLCGILLSKKCGYTPNVPLVPTFNHKDSKSTIDFDWQFIVIGLGFGAGVGMVFGPLLFWTKGRKWFDEQVNRLLLKILPSTGLNYNICDDGRVEAEENMEEELEEITGDYDDTEEDEKGPRRGRFCVFCTKLDISKRRVIHNTSCTCRISPLNSSSL